MKYFYTAYNLTFGSEIPLPELTAVQGAGDQLILDPDVQICLGSVPVELDNPISSGVLYQSNERHFLLNFPEIGRYLVSDGNRISVEPAPGALQSDIRVFMLGSIFGALLHQRHLLVIHAGAIHTEAGAVLFAGISGVGKSTLLGELLNRGYPMIVDDVCAVTLDNGKPVVLPGYPRTRLWADSADKLDVDTNDLPRTRPELEKFERQLPEQFRNEPSALHHIFLLSRHNNDEIYLEPLPAIQTFATVVQNTYRNAILDVLDMREPHFELVSAVSSVVTVTKATRPIDGFRLTELADKVEQRLLEL